MIEENNWISKDMKSRKWEPLKNRNQKMSSLTYIIAVLKEMTRLYVWCYAYFFR